MITKETELVITKTNFQSGNKNKIVMVSFARISLSLSFVFGSIGVLMNYGPYIKLDAFENHIHQGLQYLPMIVRNYKGPSTYGVR